MSFGVTITEMAVNVPHIVGFYLLAQLYKIASGLIPVLKSE
jgi:hypothetical protein